MTAVRFAGASLIVASAITAAFGQQSDSEVIVSALRPLIMTTRPNPKYPKSVKGVSGFVRVECMVTPRGRTEDCRVLDSEPAGVFDEAALKAMNNVRFKPWDGQESRLMMQRLLFSPD